MIWNWNTSILYTFKRSLQGFFQIFDSFLNCISSRKTMFQTLNISNIIVFLSVNNYSKNYDFMRLISFKLQTFSKTIKYTASCAYRPGASGLFCLKNTGFNRRNPSMSLGARLDACALQAAPGRCMTKARIANIALPCRVWHHHANGRPLAPPH